MSRRGENIRKRKDGRWEGRYSYRIGDKKITKSVYSKNYLEVKRKLTEAKTAVENKNFHSISSTDVQYSFGSYANLWLEFVKKNRKPSTHAKYRAIYEKYLTVIVDESIHHIDEKFLCEKVFSKNNVKSDSIKKSIIMIVNQVIKYCNGLNHCKSLHLPSRPAHRILRELWKS